MIMPGPIQLVTPRTFLLLITLTHSHGRLVVQTLTPLNISGISLGKQCEADLTNLAISENLLQPYKKSGDEYQCTESGICVVP